MRWLTIVGSAAFLATNADSADLSSDAFSLGCGEYRAVDLARFDYRMKDVSPQGKKKVWDLDTYHTIPARKELNTPSPYAPRVIGNLDFSLRHSPNHHEALALLIRYELAGGNLLTYPTARCYLDWAHRFTPDDATVLLFGGNYFWKKNDTDRAEAWYKRALEFDPASAETHYNLGLMYFDLKLYARAKEHALAAYSAGFPLPGLRDRLSQVGYRLEPLPVPSKTP